MPIHHEHGPIVSPLITLRVGIQTKASVVVSAVDEGTLLVGLAWPFPWRPAQGLLLPASLHKIVEECEVVAVLT